MPQNTLTEHIPGFEYRATPIQLVRRGPAQVGDELGHLVFDRSDRVLEGDTSRKGILCTFRTLGAASRPSSSLTLYSDIVFRRGCETHSAGKSRSSAGFSDLS
jgi:hypothetical protein